MNRFEEILIKPIITERSNMDMQMGKYTFKVKPCATKTEIKDAVESLFNVKVENVNTMRYEGKEKRVGHNVGKRNDWKKAIVKIDMNPENKGKTKYNNSIEIFHGQQA